MNDRDRQERVSLSGEALMKELQGPPFHTMHTISLMRGLFELCDPCYEIVVLEKLVDARNYAPDH